MNTTPAWSTFANLSDSAALNKIHADDRRIVTDTHAKLPGQTLSTTAHNLLCAGIVRPA